MEDAMNEWNKITAKGYRQLYVKHPEEDRPLKFPEPNKRKHKCKIPGGWSWKKNERGNWVCQGCGFEHENTSIEERVVIK